MKMKLAMMTRSLHTFTTEHLPSAAFYQAFDTLPRKSLRGFNFERSSTADGSAGCHSGVLFKSSVSSSEKRPYLEQHCRVHT